MPWNWSQSGWPDFIYDVSAVDDLERQFLRSSGELLGAVRHIDSDEAMLLRIEILSDEAIKTSVSRLLTSLVSVSSLAAIR